MKRVLRTVLILLAVCCIALLARKYVITAVRVTGTSMENTLLDGDVVLVTRWDYRFGRSPERGDIVQCTFGGRADVYVKRVVGLPNELIVFEDETLTINGIPLTERYALGATEDYRAELHDNEYLLLGDNRAVSYDSRAEEMGTVGRESFSGRVRWILWPLNRFGPVN